MLENIKIAYIIGVGGISMSAIARFLHAEGIEVLGSDITINDEIKKLLKDNIIKFKLKASKEFVKSCDIVIFSSAISENNSDLLYAKKLGKPIFSRAEILGQLTQNKKTISIAGTHGKTTTTGLISSVLLSCGLNPNIHIGGVLKNINSNVHISKSDLFVTEACEYKDSFLSFKNYISVVLNIKPDHLDYFKSLENEFSSFQKFVDNTAEDGYVIVNNDDKLSQELNIKCNKITYAIENDALVKAQHIMISKDGHISFDVFFKGSKQGRIKLSCLGLHNVYNALACCGVCYALGVPFNKIQKGIATFKGIARRFEILQKNKKRMIVHDYAHHPDEIKAILNLCRFLKYKKVVAIFQPHTYSRTRDLYPQFLGCFDAADEVWLLPIYPAREKPIKGVSSYNLAKDLSKNHIKAQYFNSFEKCEQAIINYKEKGVVFAILGAGDIVELAYLFKKN